MNDKENKEEEEQSKPILVLNETIQQTNKENEETDTAEQMKKMELESQPADKNEEEMNS